MTDIQFHVNLGDKVGYACRLLRKASSAGARVWVVGDGADIAALDAALWTFAPLEFLAHAQLSSPASQRARSTVCLTSHAEVEALPTPWAAFDATVLLNLGTALPQGFEQFARLIELVSMDPPDRQSGIARWKHYAGRGYEIKKHDMAPAALVD